MRFNVLISFETDDAVSCVKALTNDDNGVYKRTSSEVYNEGNKVYIKLNATDVTALRAGLNDYVRLIKICECERCLDE
jgi:tRNA threonylcarbamoyladenosine modification (KEOPS) complex  Pcc1 subunit